MTKRDESRLPKNHYFTPEYLKRERLYSYVEQIEVIKKYARSEDNILEIGKGNGFLYQFLRDYLGYKVDCLDINSDLNPDIIDDIIKPQNLSEKSYDIVTCFEVVEHMPFADSIISIQNLCKTARNYCLVSIPDMRYFINIKSTIFGTLPVSFGKLFSTKRFRNKNKTFAEDHHWEIGITVDDQTYSPHFIRENLFQGMNVIADFRCSLVPWHHYYVIKI